MIREVAQTVKAKETAAPRPVKASTDWSSLGKVFGSLAIKEEKMPAAVARKAPAAAAAPAELDRRLSDSSALPKASARPATGSAWAFAGSQGSFGPKLDFEELRERQALNDLDRYGDVLDNPGGGDTDGTISTGDLEDIASGDYNQESARQRLIDLGVKEDQIDSVLSRLETSADYLLENDDLRDALDTGEEPGSDTDGKISRSDLSAEIFRRQVDDPWRQTGPAASNRDSYEAVEASNAERSTEVIRAQEQSVLDAVTGGQPVQFQNSNGETEELSIRQVDGGSGKTVYELTGEDGHTIRIESELGASENRTALARIADYYSQLPPGVRDSNDRIVLSRNPDDSAAADFRSREDRIRFYDGLAHLNEEVFNHEYGHAIGYDEDGLGENGWHRIGQVFSGSDGEGTPRGWDAAAEADPGSVSGYADGSRKEDFAESWAAYLEARENGPEALARLEEAIPSRFAILEQVYEEALA